MLIRFTSSIFIGLIALWIVYRVARTWHRRWQHKEAPFESEMVLSLLFVYALMLIGLTLFPIALNMPNQQHPSNAYNLKPFRGIFNYVEYAGFSRETIVNILGNIAAFFPLGFLLPLHRRRFHGFWRVLFIGFLISCGIEFLQWTGFPYDRKLDIDDVILNTLGTMLGYMVANGLALPILHRLRPQVAIWAPRSHK